LAYAGGTQLAIRRHKESRKTHVFLRNTEFLNRKFGIAKNMLILGIESSCDDTSVALLNCSSQGCVVVSEKTASQIDIHKKYGGVVPEIAGRAHAEKITPLIELILENQPQPDAIAVTAGPGLITGLLVGVEAARTLSYALKIPVVAVNHIEGHIYSTEIAADSKIEFPALCLVVSGGHTELILIKKPRQYKLLGATRDDAAGECFDKVAKLVDLPYPGGPQISKLGKNGNPQAIKFPRPMINDDNYNFSFAGLKTSALYWLRDHKINKKITLEDFCASLEQAIVDVLVSKTVKAVQEFRPKTIVVGGGVSANLKLRETFADALSGSNIKYPDLKYCMDNAAMIAVAGYYHTLKEDFTNWRNLKADPNWKIV